MVIAAVVAEEEEEEDEEEERGVQVGVTGAPSLPGVPAGYRGRVNLILIHTCI